MNLTCSQHQNLLKLFLCIIDEKKCLLIETTYEWVLSKLSNLQFWVVWVKNKTKKLRKKYFSFARSWRKNEGWIRAVQVQTLCCDVKGKLSPDGHPVCAPISCSTSGPASCQSAKEAAAHGANCLGTCTALENCKRHNLLACVWSRPVHYSHSGVSQKTTELSLCPSLCLSGTWLFK